MLLSLLLLITPAHAGAVDTARAMVLAQPDSAAAWVELGDAFRSKWKKKRARDAYQHAAAIEPENMEVRARMAEIGQGRASRLERKAMRQLGNDEVWGDLGDEYMAAGRLIEAEAAYRYAASIDPEDGEWQTKIANLLGPEELLAQVESGETTMGDEELGDMADLLMGQGEVERACELYQRAAQLDPSDNEWTEKLSNQCGVGGFGLGVEGFGLSSDGIYNGMGLLSSEGFSSDVVSLDSEADVLAATGRAFALMGEDKRALDFYERALAFEPTDEKLRTAVLVLSEGSLVDLLERLVLREPDEDELWGDLGDAYAAVGRRADAANAWERATELDPEDDEWGYKLGLVDPDRAAGDAAATSIRELLESE